MNKYIIPGQPIPLARPRFNGKVVFDSQKAVKKSVSDYLRLTVKEKPLTGPVHITLRFYMRRPKGKKIQALFPGLEWHSKRPDLDNLTKFILDVANGILYADDSQVVFITSAKVYSDEPRTEIEIKEL